MTLYTMKYLACIAIALSIVWHTGNGVYARRLEYGMDGTSSEGVVPRVPSLRLLQSENFLLEQLLAAANENRNEYIKLQNYRRRRPNYLMNWPGLRELSMGSADYANNIDKSHEIDNSHVIDELQDLSELSQDREDLENGRTDLEQDKISVKNYEISDGNQLEFKAPGSKKSFKFFSPCRFKLCTMGKRVI